MIVISFSEHFQVVGKTLSLSSIGGTPVWIYVPVLLILVRILRPLLSLTFECVSALCSCRHCPDSRRTFTKRLMLEKHIQLMHGIKDPDVKEMTESTNMEEREVKEDAKVITWEIRVGPFKWNCPSVGDEC